MDKNIHSYEQCYFASCSLGLETVLSKELQSFGAKQVTIARGGAEFKGNSSAISAILNSRVASRILKKVCSFEAPDEKTLYRNAVQISWSKIFDVNLTFKIQAIISNQVFKNSVYLSQLFKDAVVDSFRKTTGKRPNVKLNNPDVNLILRAERLGTYSAKVSIYIDLCGTPLHERGYRINSGPAPLKENLAAGILLVSEWDNNSDVFIDTMCGSGTFLIEAALIKFDIPPSFVRIKSKKPWAIEKLNFFKEKPELKVAFDTEIKNCRQKSMAGLEKAKSSPVRIFGYDINDVAIMGAKENIMLAGLGSTIKVTQGDAIKITPPVINPEPKSIVLCNPPYGERLGEKEKMDELYYLYGENLKNEFKGYSAVIFTGNFESAKKISLKPQYKTPLFNGKIECRVFRYPLY